MRPLGSATEAIVALAVLTLPLAIWLRYPDAVVPGAVRHHHAHRPPLRSLRPHLRNPGSAALPSRHLRGDLRRLRPPRTTPSRASCSACTSSRPCRPTSLQSRVHAARRRRPLGGVLLPRLSADAAQRAPSAGPYRFLGARCGWGLILAAILFGLCHIVTGDLTRLRVVFFGLFAGWLRERTDTIAVPAAYHGFANLLYEFMARSMR